jgi:hypothetical protein
MRKVTWGTPGRSEHYIFPRGKWAFVRPSLLAAFTLGSMILLLYVLGAAWPTSPLRRSFSPGPVIGAHATFETSCQGCHAPSEGASNTRCQRCHDPGGAGRLDNRAHVLFGSADAKKAAASPNLRCAQCHIEHRGRDTELAGVHQGNCVSCHFRSMGDHPEFAVLRAKSNALPGLHFGHGPVSATASFKGHVNEVMTKRGVTSAQACLVCHEPSGKDLQPISFARHCAECHNKDMQATVGLPEDDVVAPTALTALGVAMNDAEFEKARGKVAKTTVRHKDDWIVASVRRLHAELEPAAAASERAALKAQLGRLQQRLALAQPLATLDEGELKVRQVAIFTELKGIEQRVQAQKQAPGGPFERVDEALASAYAAGAAVDPALKDDAAAIRRDADALRGKAVEDKPDPAFDAHRKQVLSLLDGIETADPRLKARVGDLRRRTLALTAGDSTLDVLARAKEQRQSQRERLADELRLRAGGPLPAASAVLLGAGRALQSSVEDVEAQLRRLDAVPPGKTTLTDEEKARKKESLDSLLTSCVKCHVVEQSALARVRAAQPVLVRAKFIHQPHLLQADCVRCHSEKDKWSIEKSGSAKDLNFRGVESCRECHRPRAVRQDCLTCHKYHAPSLS